MIFRSTASLNDFGSHNTLHEEQRRKPPKANRHRAHNDLAKGLKHRNEHLKSNNLKTLSWRVGAYRKTPTVSVSVKPSKKEPGAYGMLVLMDEAARLPPKQPMVWISPLNETSNESALFQYYGANIPALHYGIRQDGLWCPVRAMSMPCGFMYPSQFRWMLIMSETHMAARKGVPPPMSLYKRKAAAYQQVNAALADPDNKYSFETILSVNAALFVEARIVGPDITRMHLKALDQLLMARNRRFAEGKDSFATLLGFSIYTAYLLCECEAASRAHLRNTVRASIAKFEVIQRWVIMTWELIDQAVSGPSWNSPTRRFQAAKHRLLHHRAVKPLLTPSPVYVGYTHIASHFGTLLLLNLSLCELGQDIGAFFLDRLLLIVDNSMDVDRVTGKPLLKLPALPMMIAQVRLDVLHNYTRRDLHIDDDVEDESLETSSAMIDALKFFSYLSDSSRKQLIAVLFGWLMDEPGSRISLSGGIFDAMEEETQLNWTKEQMKPKMPSPISQ